MKKLMHLEFRRLFRSKTFYICLAVSLVMVLITGVTSKLVYNAIKSEETLATFGYDSNAPTALSLMKGIGSSSLLMVMAVFITLFVTEDYAGNTIKNISSKGYSSDLIFLSKYVASLTACMFFLFSNALFALAVGVPLFGHFGSAGHFFAGSLAAILMVVIAYISVYYMVAISIRKVGGSLAICLVGPVVLNLILLLADSISSKVTVSDYWMDGILTNLSANDVSGKTLAIAFIVGFNLFAGSMLISFFANRKKDQ